jgi:hypothetical protein
VNQRLQSLQQLGEDFERLSADVAALDNQARHGRLSRLSPPFAPGIRRKFVLACVPLALAAVVIGLVTGRNRNNEATTMPRLSRAEASLVSEYVIFSKPQNPTARAAAGSGPASALNQEIFDYPVLARSQSPAARGGAGKGPAQFLTGTSGLNLTSSSGSLHFHVRTVGWARYENVPSLTREVTQNDVHVWFFVVYHPVTQNLPRAIVTGNDPRGAARYTTRRYLTLLRQHVNSSAGYQLWVRVGDNGTPQPIAPKKVLAARATPAAFLGTPQDQRSANLSGYLTTETATISGPRGTIVAIVPREVTRLSWTWPRDFMSSTLSFLPRLTESATVTDNVAVLDAPKRYTSGPEFGPETVTYFKANGKVLARYTNTAWDTLQSEHTFETRNTPAPETARSRAAERDPSTPNRALILPGVTKLQPIKISGKHKTFYEFDPSPLIVFNPLLNNRNYYAHVSAGPRPSCVVNPSSTLVNRTETRRESFLSGHGRDGNLRGSSDSLPISATITCPGTYRISISVLKPNGHPYKPFATVTLKVRKRN